MIRRPPRSTLFPYRRSSDLSPDNVTQRLLAHVPLLLHPEPHSVVVVGMGTGDRKSTRLNSSHSQISYAVFCLKKKKGSGSTAVLSRQREAQATSMAVGTTKE